MTELVINGIDLETIKTHRLAIAKTASSMMSKRVDEMQQMIDTILESEDKLEIEELSKQATVLLEEIQAIHNATAVEYDIPYDTEWDSGNSNRGKLESLCEDLEIEEGSINELMAQLEDMEYNSNEWNSSSC